MIALITDRTAADLVKLETILAKDVRDWTPAELMYFWHGEGTFMGILTAEGAALWTSNGPVQSYAAGDGVVRGAYNHTDLNRVTAAMDDLHGRLTAYGYRTGYQPVEVVPGRFLWWENEIPTREQMEDYMNNLRALRSVLRLLSSTPNVPADAEKLTYGEANDIEQMLIDADHQVVTMATTFIPAGEAISGGDNL